MFNFPPARAVQSPTGPTSISLPKIIYKIKIKNHFCLIFYTNSCLISAVRPIKKTCRVLQQPQNTSLSFDTHSLTTPMGQLLYHSLYFCHESNSHDNIHTATTDESCILSDTLPNLIWLIQEKTLSL